MTLNVELVILITEIAKPVLMNKKENSTLKPKNVSALRDSEIKKVKTFAYNLIVPENVKPVKDKPPTVSNVLKVLTETPLTTKPVLANVVLDSTKVPMK